MGVEQAWELEAMFSTAEFGTIGAFRWDENELSVPGLFDDPTLTVAPTSSPGSSFSPLRNTAADITTQQPRFIVATHLVASVPKRATLYVDGHEWVISDKRPDGGLTQFFLHAY